MIYLNVDSPNLGFPYSYFLGGYQWKNHPVGSGDVNAAHAILEVVLSILTVSPSFIWPMALPLVFLSHVFDQA